MENDTIRTSPCLSRSSSCWISCKRPFIRRHGPGQAVKKKLASHTLPFRAAAESNGCPLRSVSTKAGTVLKWSSAVLAWSSDARHCWRTSPRHERQDDDAQRAPHGPLQRAV